MGSYKRKSHRILEEEVCTPKSISPFTLSLSSAPPTPSKRKSNTSMEEDSDSLTSDEADETDSPKIYPCLMEMWKENVKLQQTHSCKPNLSKDAENGPETQAQSKKNLRYIVALLTTLSVVILCTFTPLYRSSSPLEQEERYNLNSLLEPVRINYTELRHDMTFAVKKLREDFPESKVELWKSIWACIYSILEATPPQPGVLVLAPEHTDAVPTSQCLARKLASIISNLLQRIANRNTNNEWTLNASSFPDNDSAMEFMEQVKRKLTSHGLILIENADTLPGKVAMMLHGLCDNEHSPFKQSVMILLLSRPPEDQGSFQESVDNYLTEVWTKSGNLKIDTISSLVSRVSNYAAFVGAESQHPC